MKHINLENYNKELSGLQSRMMEVEAGLSNLNPQSRTFELELPMFEKRQNILSCTFSNLIQFLPKIKQDRPLVRNQVKMLIELNNRILMQLDILRTQYRPGMIPSIA
ncbi:MAG: hypothetical protein EXR21_01910 [Flavobacteriaceae bacterium]|nr:hypothetical protein [Flavobacteriaceae bacterium]